MVIGIGWAGLALAAERPPAAAEGGMVTDRPGFSESAQVVGRGMLQWESGFQFGRLGLDGERTTATVGPYPLLRLGVSRRVELRFSGDGYRRERRGGEAVRGVTDFVVGGEGEGVGAGAVATGFRGGGERGGGAGEPAVCASGLGAGGEAEF